MSPQPAPSERGGVALLTLMAGMLVTVAGLALVVAAADVTLAAVRARTAADAAALAAAGASPLAGGDGDARSAASRLAAANGGQLVACCGPDATGPGVPPAGASPVAVVEVVVHPRLGALRAVVLRVRAAAGLRPGDMPGVPPPPPAAAGALPTAGTGRLHWPVVGHLTSGYGWRRHPVAGVARLHTGADFAASTGTAVVAAADGTVVSAAWRGGYGLTVVVDHGGGLSTLSAHLSAVAVRRGQRVSRGAVIGRVGCTGTCTGPHLHFEVHEGGRPRDPLPYLRP